MTIKSRISLYISIIFSILFLMVCSLVISLFSNFRKEEFKERLNEKAMTTIRLLLEVQEVDNEQLKIIEQNTINRLYNEKTLIFDADFNLIYSSLDDTKIDWNKEDLLFLKENNEFFKSDGENELYGIFYDSNNDDYYALVSANDNLGKRNLHFLFWLLIGAGIIFILFTWILTFRVVKKQLIPLDNFHLKIKNINDLNIETQLESSENTKNEISLITNEFNFMMTRITDVYEKQKEFTSQASHELRTPIARMSAQLENQMLHCNESERALLKNIFSNVNQLNELINSLLILSKIDNKKREHNESCRVDEVIYASIEQVNKIFPDFKVSLNIREVENLDELLQVNANAGLLEIVFTNLLKNAFLYSENKSASIDIASRGGTLLIKFINNGVCLAIEEQKRLFQPFMRGQNSQDKSGLGLGLRIVSRILRAYNFSIIYESESGLNTFTITF